MQLLLGVKHLIDITTVKQMLSRSKGRHKTTFQRLPMSINPKFADKVIIGLGLLSSLAALLMVIEFIGLKPDLTKVFEISSQAYASVADSLTGIAHSLIEKKAAAL